MRRFVYFFILLTLLSPFSAFSQAWVQGRVTGPDGKALEFVNVGILNASTPVGTTSDFKGWYRLQIPKELLLDSVRLRFSFTGFETVEFSLFPRHGQTLQQDCRLRTSTTTLQEVSVVDDRSRQTSFTHIDVQKLQNAVGPNNGVESLLKTLPDVNSNNEMSSQYSVRGGSFDENLVYINDIEVYRPMLVRSGQQEGLSIINSDMVDHILFSPGGFDASYGDRLSSALDITYGRPSAFRAQLSASLLGGSAFAEGTLGSRFAYSVGFRHHNNSYLFSSLDTKGQYHTSYTDLQAFLSYTVSSALDVSLLAIVSRNIYGLVPESQTTTFGSFMESLQLDIFFDGGEEDRYDTRLGALLFDLHPNDDNHIKFALSAQSITERECYDIQSQYWLYELGVGSEVGEVNRFDRGVGTFLEHARNSLQTHIFALDIKGTHNARLGQWSWGVKGQLEKVSDHVREWKWVDSAGYALPTTHSLPGSDLDPHSPLLQLFCSAANQVTTLRTSAFAQRELKFFSRHDHQFKFVAGIRGQYYRQFFDHLSTPAADTTSPNHQFLLSPRISLNLKPNWDSADMLFRLAGGVYQQAPFYREMRYIGGGLNTRIQAQTSYQATASLDWNFHLSDMPFKFTADIYYKYITHLIPYTIDNMRLRYDAHNNAVAYAAGISLRLNGELLPGLESWASLSLMQTQEDILGDNLGWIRRPTDQRFSFKMFFQDNLPSMPWWKMSLNFLFGSRLPVTFPYQQDRSAEFHLPSYFRVDWGNTVCFSQIKAFQHSRLFRFFDDIQLGIEVFNLFNYHNVISFIWVADYENTYYPVPNYLTARQVNLKLTLVF